MLGELWFAEGFTSYYPPLFIRRAGIADDGDYVKKISRVINTVIKAPGRRFFSPVEMSMQAPFVDAAVSIDPKNSDNTFISYYDWGSVIGLGLAFILCTRFHTTLNDYMRVVWFAHGQTERPYTLADLERVLGETVGDAVFAADFFRRHINETEVMDYVALLANGGHLLRRANSGAAWIGANILSQGGGAQSLARLLSSAVRSMKPASKREWSCGKSMALRFRAQRTLMT